MITAVCDTDIEDAQSASVAASYNKKHFITKFVTDALDEYGYAVINNVLDKSDIENLQLAVENIISEGRMKISSGNSITVRQDRVCFIKESDGTEAALCKTSREYQKHLPIMIDCISMLRGIAERLEYNGYKRSRNHLVPMQCQLAHYAGNGNASYKAHRDAAKDNNFWQVGLLGW